MLIRCYARCVRENSTGCTGSWLDYLEVVGVSDLQISNEGGKLVGLDR